MSDATKYPSYLLLIVILAGAVVMHVVPHVRDYLLTTRMIVGLGGAVCPHLATTTERNTAYDPYSGCAQEKYSHLEILIVHWRPGIESWAA